MSQTIKIGKIGWKLKGYIVKCEKGIQSHCWDVHMH